MIIVEYAKILRVTSVGDSLQFICKYPLAPVGEEVFVVQGVNRIRYVNMDSDYGKEIALRIVKKQAWNITKVKVRSTSSSLAYTIPKNFAKALGIRKGEKIMIIGLNNKLEVIPLKYVLEKIGAFKEPII